MKKVIFIGMFLLGMLGLNASTPRDCFGHAIKVADGVDADRNLSHDEYTKIINEAYADCWKSEREQKD